MIILSETDYEFLMTVMHKYMAQSIFLFTVKMYYELSDNDYILLMHNFGSLPFGGISNCFVRFKIKTHK